MENSVIDRQMIQSYVSDTFATMTNRLLEC